MERSVATDVDRPVFVIGYGHSGTTLLLRMIQAHPAFFAPRGETKFFAYLPAIRAQFRDLSSGQTSGEYARYLVHLLIHGWDVEPLQLRRGKVDPDGMDEVIDEVREYLERRPAHEAGFVKALDILTLRAGKDRWLEKTPPHVFHVDDIVRAVDNPLFVEIVRDPRDVLASKKTRRRGVWTDPRYREEQRSEKHLKFAYDPVWESLSWRSAVDAGHAAKKNYTQSVHSLRYEDLVHSPEATLRGLCSFLGLDFTDSMLAVTQSNPSEIAQEQPATGVVTTSVGRWRKVLRPAEVYVVQRLTKREMLLHAYEPQSVGLREGLGAGPLILRSVFDFARRAWRRFRMGGLRYLRVILQGYLRRLRIVIRAK